MPALSTHKWPRGPRVRHITRAGLLSSLILSSVIASACNPPTIARAGAETAVNVTSAGNSSLTYPQRIVSLDFCADQYVLKLAEREHILALSPDAEKPHSYLREQAKGLPKVKAIAESIIELQPDLVIRTYGGGPDIAELLERVRIPTLQIGWTGSIADIKRVTREVAAGLGVAERGDALVAEMKSRIVSLPQPTEETTALYMTPSGATTGTGSLVHELMTKVGLSNFQTQPGWHPLPLERLASESPDTVVAAFFDTNSRTSSSWSAMRHPVAQAQLTEQATVYLNGAWMACGAWFVTDAMEAMSYAEKPSDLP